MHRYDAYSFTSYSRGIWWLQSPQVCRMLTVFIPKSFLPWVCSSFGLIAELACHISLFFFFKLPIPHIGSIDTGHTSDFNALIESESKMSKVKAQLTFSPFHNWRTSTLQHLSIGISLPLTSFRMPCTVSRIRCMRYSSRIKSSKKWTCTLFRRHRMLSKLSQCNARTLVRTSCNVLCTRKSDAWFLKVVKWIAAVYESVLWPWDCCSMCLL